jgi:outer membrane lipoprotein-sorting protein
MLEAELTRRNHGTDGGVDFTGKAAAAMILIMAVMAAPESAAATPCASTAACLEVLEAAQRGTQTLTARFTQTKRLSLLDEPLESSGFFAFRRPDRVLWRIESPEPLTVVIRGRDIHVPGLPTTGEAGLAMAPLAAMFTQLGAVFAGSLTAAGADFEVEAVADAEAIQLTLRPRHAAWQRMVRQIELRFMGPEWLLAGMHLDNGMGDRVEIALRDVRRNAEVPEAWFATDPGP